MFMQDSRGVLFRGPRLQLLGVLGTSLACPLCVSASWASVLGCQEGDLTVGHPSHVPAGRALHADPRRQADFLPSVPCLWTSLLWCQAGMCSLFPLFPSHPHPDFHTSLSIPSFWLWCDQKITGHRAGFRF